MALAFLQLNSVFAAGPDWQKAADEAEELIAKSRRLGGDIYAAQAREILEPWWDAERLPQRIRLQRATLLQRDHHFKKALLDLNAVLKQDPQVTEAWLMKTTILTVAGRYQEARKAAVPLFGLASPLLAVTAGTAPTSCNGNLEESFEVLGKSLTNHADETAAIRCWAHTALAEMAVRMGDSRVADEHFRSALMLDPSSPYLLKNFSNFLIDAGVPEKAENLIGKQRQFFPVVWMRARKALGAEKPEMKKLMRDYEAGLKEKSRSHGHSHGRDEAVYFLKIKGDLREAVHHAAANWKSQREAADLLILLQSATEADDELVIADALRWIKKRRFEDVRLKKFMETN